MSIISLGYFGTGSRNLEQWQEFAVGLIGLQPVEHCGGTLSFRMDDWKQRIVIDASIPDGSRFFGWEVIDADALQMLADRLDRAGVPVKSEPASLANARCVTGLISLIDPAGNRLEIFHGPQRFDRPFKPGRAISGFRTGTHGMGHVVLTVERLETTMAFYTELLGFKLSDFVLAPFKAYFFHVNPRHHSLALIESDKNGMHHLMLEYFFLDDVGQRYDIAQRENNRVAVTLGRHTNDFMTSFYAYTPSGFMVECGWGGREIEPQSWQPTEFHEGPSMWGHDRNWLPPEKRLEAETMRMTAASLGLRQPVCVLPGNFRQMKGACPWWDGLTASG